MAPQPPSPTQIHPELNDDTSLLQFYQQKCIQLESERESYLKQIEAFRETYKQRHEMEWELRRREEEINRLSTVLREVQMHVYDEREHAQKLQHENDQLRLQEIEDRRKIRDLLSLTHELPEAKPSTPKGSRRKSAQVRTTSRSDAHPTSIQNAAHIVQNPSEESLRLQVESLNTQIEEMKHLWEDKERTLLDEIQTLKKEAQLRYERDKHSMERLTHELEDLREKHAQITKDHFVYSHNAHVIQRRQREKMELLNKQNANLQQQLDSLKKKFQHETTVIMSSAREQSEEFVNHFREQSIQHEQESLKLQEQLEKTKEKHAAQIEKYQHEIRTLKQKLKEMKSKRHQDKEGVSSDLENLKRDILSIDKKLSKYIQLLRLEARDERSAKDLEKRLLTANEKLYVLDKNFRKKAGRVLYSAPGRY